MQKFGLSLVTALIAAVAPANAADFEREVMGVLSRAGCNLGGCHGAQDGKGRLKLSLWGEDPAGDLAALREGGRFLGGDNPAASLLLEKPTGVAEHEGGVRFAVGSEEYRILLDWLEAGAERGREGAGEVEALVVEPAEALLELPQRELTITVRARFAGGEERDVTRWAVFETSSLAGEVTPEGRLRFEAPGETTVFVRYLDARASMRAALIDARPEYGWRGPEPAGRIDELVFAKLRRHRELPAPVCDDATFLRRASLDITGVLPTADEARAFVADPSPDKRSELVDRLLASPEYAAFWAMKWADLLRVEEKTLDATGVEKFHGWIREQLAAGAGLDRFAREVLTATGSTYTNPPANFYRALRDPSARAEAAAQVFLGSRLGCAKCHNHPFEDLRQDDYYRFAALFDGIEYEVVENKRKDKYDKNQFIGEQRVQLVSLSEVEDKERLKHPRTGEPPVAGMLDPAVPAPADESERLDAMAAWVVAQPNFAKVQANRIWAHLMGRALVKPIDDVRPTNPASNPELLAYLAGELRAGDHDPRHLIRLIAGSKSYQLSSEPGGDWVGGEANFARAAVRRLPAEVVFDAAHRALGVAPDLSGWEGGAVALPGVQEVHLSKRPGSGERFLKLFGKPARLTNSDAERSDDTTLAQAFELTGGETLTALLTRTDNRIGEALRSGAGDPELVDELYWAALTRAPAEPERAAMLGHIAAAEERDGEAGRREALEDVAWSLLNAKEFLLRR